MMLAVQPVRLTAAPRRCSSAAPRCVATCSLRERAGAALAATTLALTLAVAPPAFAKAADFGVYWLSPDDGATLSSPVAAKFGVKGLDVKPAAEGVQEGTGHHHVIVDGDFLKAGAEIPFDDTHLHFGKGQTEASIVLTPGKHKLTLQFANALHKSYGKGYAKTITVNVK